MCNVFLATVIHVVLASPSEDEDIAAGSFVHLEEDVVGAEKRGVIGPRAKGSLEYVRR